MLRDILSMASLAMGAGGTGEVDGNTRIYFGDFEAGNGGRGLVASFYNLRWLD